jgi:pyruvate/2-oxoglutarate dehydrogenase complex dihydrolipoamide acyltransferase (E2) component
MRISVGKIIVCGAVALMFSLTSAPATAKTVAECNAEYAANKDSIKASGQTKKDYVAACRAGTATAPAAAPAAPAAAAPAPAAPATAAAPAGGKTAKECNDEYSANKAAIKAGGQTKKDFVAACRAGTETIPAAAAPAPAPAPAPAAAAPAPAPVAAAPAPAPAGPQSMKPQVATGAGQFGTDAQAKARCPSDTVVWLNTKSGIYHFAGTHNYGNTKQGAYMCEADAKAAGDRAAENEKHP